MPKPTGRLSHLPSIHYIADKVSPRKPPIAPVLMVYSSRPGGSAFCLQRTDMLVMIHRLRGRSPAVLVLWTPLYLSASHKAGERQLPSSPAFSCSPPVLSPKHPWSWSGDNLPIILGGLGARGDDPTLSGPGHCRFPPMQVPGSPMGMKSAEV